MYKIIVEKPFDKHYRDEDGIFHWPVRIIQKKDIGILGSEFFFFHAEHLDHPMKGFIPDKRVKHDDIVVPQEKFSD